MTYKILFAALLVNSVPSIAQADSVETVVIQASNLETAQGARRFRSALNGALDHICGAYAASEHDQWLAIDKCRATAMKSVNQQLAANAARKDFRVAIR